MTLLTVNAGSSSIRLDVFALDPGGPKRLASQHDVRPEHRAVDRLRDFLDPKAARPIDAVAHRVVHGGEKLVAPCLIDEGVEAEIARLAPLAPLHNPAALAWLHACREVLGAGVPQLAVFDTAFYAALPEAAATYALPRQLCREHGLRRFGFHGLAHLAMWRCWRGLRPELKDGGRTISLQLGAGCSITAVREGIAVDTSMGFSPLEGLVMATRSGDVDPGLLLFLQRAEGLSPSQLESLLSESSGLLGVSGVSADMRELLASEDAAARLAVSVYCHRALKYVGAYLAVLGGVDAVLFGGGVGENAPVVREKILTGMEWAGILLDPESNRAVGKQVRISSPKSSVEVWVVPVDEATVIAEDAAALLGDLPAAV